MSSRTLLRCLADASATKTRIFARRRNKDVSMRCVASHGLLPGVREIKRLIDDYIAQRAAVSRHRESAIRPRCFFSQPKYFHSRAEILLVHFINSINAQSYSNNLGHTYRSLEKEKKIKNKREEGKRISNCTHVWDTLQRFFRNYNSM